MSFLVRQRPDDLGPAQRGRVHGGGAGPAVHEPPSQHQPAAGAGLADVVHHACIPKECIHTSMNPGTLVQHSQAGCMTVVQVEDFVRQASRDMSAALQRLQAPSAAASPPVPAPGAARPAAAAPPQQLPAKTPPSAGYLSCWEPQWDAEAAAEQPDAALSLSPARSPQQQASQPIQGAGG